MNHLSEEPLEETDQVDIGKISAGLKVWGGTGSDVPDLVGQYSLPAGKNGDQDRRELLADAIAALYNCVGSAQRAERSTDPITDAVHQLVLANSALAASECDAFLTLVSIGLERPAEIHLRALGEMCIRAILCREHRSLARKIYESAEPSWRRLASKMPIENPPEFDKSEFDMRKLEQTEEFKTVKKTVVEKYRLMDELAFTMWSKRSHGDIYALVQVSQSLVDRDGDVRKAISQATPVIVAGNVIINQAIGYALACIANIATEFVTSSLKLCRV